MRAVFVPPVFPDETLASFALRLWLLSGGQQRRDINEMLFGARHRQPSHVVAHCVAHFSTALEHARLVPTSEDWLLRHTHFPYFAVGLNARRLATLRQRMLGTDFGPALPARAMSLSERIGHQPMFCPMCARRDVEQLGFPFVRRAHMCPYVEACAEHGVRLMRVSDWPSRTAFLRLCSMRAVETSSEDDVRFARWSRTMLEVGSRVDDTRLRDILRAGGLLDRRGLKKAALMETVGRRFPSMLVESRTAGAVRGRRVLEDLLGSLERRRRHPHPVAVVLACASILDGPEALDTLETMEKPRPGARRVVDAARVKAELEGSSTLTGAALRLGLSVTTVAVHARALGMPVARRAKALTDDVVASIKSKLAEGLPPARVAVEAGTSLSSVYRVLSYSPEVRQYRLSAELALKDAKRDARRREWLSAREQWPDARASHWHAMLPATWKWLYRHDRRWLERHSAWSGAAVGPAEQTPSQSPRARTRTASGDEATMIARIEAAADELLALPGAPVRLTRTAVARRAGMTTLSRMNVPQHGRVEEALAKRCDTLQSFVTRRLEWAANEVRRLGLPLRAWRLLRHARLRPETVARSGVDIAACIARLERLESRVSA